MSSHFMNAFNEFKSMKKIFWIVLLLPLMSSILEVVAVGKNNITLDEEALQFAAFVFFFTNVITLFVVFWTMVVMMHTLANKTLPMKISSVVFSLLKSGFTVIIWSLMIVMIVSAVLGMFFSDQDIVQFITNKEHFSVTHQIVIISLSFFLFSLVYAIFATSLAGSVLRAQLKRAKKPIKTLLAKWYLPFTALFASMRQPLIWLPLLIAMTLKVCGLLAISKGYPWVSFVTEPIFYLCIFFSFSLSYTVYARPFTEEFHHHEP